MIRSDGHTATQPEIKQARWKTKVSIAPGHKRLSKKQKNKIRTRGKDVELVIRDLYDTLFLSPDRSKKAITSRFIPSAATALLRQKKPGVPVGAEEVKTLRRTASIGIEAATTRLAAAEVLVKAKGRLSDKTFTVTHRATLWLEKSKGRWKVIAFEVNQGPAR